MAQVRRKIDNIAHRRSKRHKAHKVYGTPLEVLTVLTRSEIPEIVRDLVRFIEKGTWREWYSLLGLVATTLHTSP